MPSQLAGGYQCFSLEDGGTVFLPNVGIYIQVHRNCNPEYGNQHVK
jgi:hypothetical protein